MLSLRMEVVTKNIQLFIQIYYCVQNIPKGQNWPILRWETKISCLSPNLDFLSYLCPFIEFTYMDKPIHAISHRIWPSSKPIPIRFFKSHRISRLIIVLKCLKIQIEKNSSFLTLYMPYFKSHRIFRPSYNTFYEEININHTLLFLSQASYI